MANLRRVDALSRRRLAVVVSLAALSGLAVAMVVARITYTGSGMYANLVWNLVLAWIPFAIAVAVYDAERRGARGVVLLVGGAVWLVFFPNAPYLVTDFQLLPHGTAAPLWYDVALVSTAAWTGLLLGLVSLYLVHSVARRAVGTEVAWAGIVLALAATSFGIYLGRFERWNSWDVVSQPRALGSAVAERLLDPDPRTLGMTAVFTTFLALAYFAFYSVVRLANVEQREPR